MKNFKLGLGLAAVAAVSLTALTSASVFAYGDSDGGRKTYTIEEINSGAIGDKIVLNSISDNPTVGNELYFVQARLDGSNDLWNSNELTVEDGKTYVVRMYVHNNSPLGTDAIMKDVKANFHVPTETGKSTKISGTIYSSNATPKSVWDDVVFKSNANFHLEYISGSAKIENNGKLDGTTLSDDLVMGGTTLGYDSLNGEIPGCFGYSAFVGFKVKVVYDYDYTVEKQVRVIGGEKVWAKQVYAKVGDTVEYQIHYKNTSDVVERNIQLLELLGSSQEYIPGTTKLYDTNHPKGVELEDGLTKDGINIGDANPNGDAYVRFRVKIVDNKLGCGVDNVLRSWAQGYIGSNSAMKQDYADVLVHPTCPEKPEEPTEPTEPTEPEPETPAEIVPTGPAAIAGSVLGAGSLVTSAGYYIASRRRF